MSECVSRDGKLYIIIVWIRVTPQKVQISNQNSTQQFTHNKTRVNTKSDFRQSVVQTIPNQHAKFPIKTMRWRGLGFLDSVREINKPNKYTTNSQDYNFVCEIAPNLDTLSTIQFGATIKIITFIMPSAMSATHNKQIVEASG